MRLILTIIFMSVSGLTGSLTLLAAEVSSPRHAVIAADNGKLVRFDRTGKVEWVFEHVRSVHRIQQLKNGNLLTQQGWGKIIEINPQGEIVWEYDSANLNGNSGKRVEVHAFQRLENGLTMIAENGVGRILEVTPEKSIALEIPMQVQRPNAHHDARQSHRLKNGHFLVCHEEEGRVAEYDRRGQVVWNYEVPLFDKPRAGGHGPEAWGNQVFNALRLVNGNTLIATGNGHSVIEVTSEKEVVWAVHQHDLPGITLAWVTSLEVLPNGNLIIGNCHAGPTQPQLIEITRDKQVVWTFKDFEILGNSTAASATVGISGDVLR